MFGGKRNLSLYGEPGASAASAAKWVWPQMDKDNWGRRGWRWLHTVAIYYAEDPTPQEALYTLRRIKAFIYGLPCPKCCQHAIEYCTKTPPDMTDTHSLQLWAWNFHNAVNRRLKKPEMPYSAYQEMYSEELSRAGWR